LTQALADGASRSTWSVAVMQPYLFPYVGAYQLVAAVDEFVVLDDAAFMKKSYLQRNSVLLAGQAHAFSAPVHAASQNRRIIDHCFAGDWAPLLKLLQSAYGRAPMFGCVMPLIQSVLCDHDENLARKNTRSLQAVCDYLGLRRTWRLASSLMSAHPLRGQARIIDLCRQVGATAYINPPGGRALYDAASFDAAGIALNFIAPRQSPYAQPAPSFVPNLSIIDLLMHLPPEIVRERLDDYALTD
jgi:hypothetical protein